MNNKMNNMINEFMVNVDFNDEKELDDKLQEFMEKYNAGEIEYENTKLDDAYELLDKAQSVKSEKKAKEYATKAYEMCDACFAAVVFLAELEKKPEKRMKILSDGLDFEKKRLTKQGYFEKENIGHFYGIYETRPYIRGLYFKMQYLIYDGKIKQARDVCKEIIRLNENDNTGARYYLMAIYAYLEEEKELLKLYKKYPEESFAVLFTMLILYYKQDNHKKAKEYLNKIKKENKHFMKMMKEEFSFNINDSIEYYSIGSESEILMYFQEYFFLIISVPSIREYIIKINKEK